MPAVLQPDLSAEERVATLFRTHHDDLARYAARRVSAGTEADDVVSETFTIAWRRFDELEAADNPVAWLYGVAANVIRNRQRTMGRHLRLVEKAKAQPASAVPTDPAEAAMVELRTALRNLSDDDREVLMLITWEGLSHADAAVALDCSVNAVAIRVHRARQRLADALETLTTDPSEDDQ